MAMVQKKLLFLFFIIKGGYSLNCIYDTKGYERDFDHGSKKCDLEPANCMYREITYLTGQCSTVKNNSGCVYHNDLITKCYCNTDLCNVFLANISNNTTDSSASPVCSIYSINRTQNMTMTCDFGCMIIYKKKISRGCVAENHSSGCEEVEYDNNNFSVWDTCYCSGDNCNNNTLRYRNVENIIPTTRAPPENTSQNTSTSQDDDDDDDGRGGAKNLGDIVRLLFFMLSIHLL